jgi:single-strand DNA-binding protein
LPPSESWKDRDGNKQERTEWHNVVIFNEPLGKIAKQYLRKGSKCYVEGQLQTRKWTAQDGSDKYTTEVVLQKFGGALVLLGDQNGGSGGGGQAPQQQRTQPQQQQRPQPAAFDLDLDDDVPF